MHGKYNWLDILQDTTRLYSSSNYRHETCNGDLIDRPQILRVEKGIASHHKTHHFKIDQVACLSKHSRYTRRENHRRILKEGTSKLKYNSAYLIENMFHRKGSKIYVIQYAPLSWLHLKLIWILSSRNKLIEMLLRNSHVVIYIYFWTLAL